MTGDLVVPCMARTRLGLMIGYFLAVSASSLRLYKASHSAGPWIAAIFAVLISVPIYRLCLTKAYVFASKPKAIRCETRFLGLLVKTEAVDAASFRWVQSRTGSFNPKDVFIELGIEHNYDTTVVQTIKDALGETAEIIATRAQIASVLGIADRGHERMPEQRVSP
jgi:hypothetical protein